MKKVLLALLIIVALIVGAAWFLLGNAGSIIKEQIEQQGSKFLDTPVSVSDVKLSLREGRLGINGVQVKNPNGFSQANAFSLGGIKLNLGSVSGEPYTVQEVNIAAPAILYEVDSSGKGNLLALKDNLMKNLPKGDPGADNQQEGTAVNPKVIVEKVTVSDVQLKLNFEQFDLGDIDVGKKVYEVTLPTFHAGSVGKPNGLPADQVGAAIVDKMLDNIIAQAEAEAKNRAKAALKAKAKEKLEKEKAKLKEKLDKEKNKLEEKAKEKLKDIFN